MSILRNDISEKTKEEFYGVYQFSQSFEDSYVHNWSGFLDSVRWKSLRRIEPKNALCLEHLRHFSVEQRAQLLGLVISLFSNSYGIESWLSLHRLLRVKNRLEKVLGGGHDAYSYTIDSEFVNLEDDGDGALPEEEIIKIRLTHEEFERLIVVWQSSLIHDLRFSSHEIAFLKL